MNREKQGLRVWQVCTRYVSGYQTQVLPTFVYIKATSAFEIKSFFQSQKKYNLSHDNCFLLSTEISQYLQDSLLHTHSS